MIRDEWKFTYTAADLAAAALMQRTFREGRIEVWKQKKDEVMQRIRDTGITIEESVAEKLSAASYVSTRSGARGSQIRVDATMQRDLEECEDKIARHTKLRDEYAAWVQVLQGKQLSLELDHEDWIYFFGKL